MSFHAARLSRATIVVAAAAALYIGAVGFTPPAWAHVHASTDTATRGAMALVTFEVPNESDKGAATTALTVALPDVASARTEAMPGWTAKLDRDVSAGTVRSVTWTAAPNGGIGVDQFALFRVSVKLPDADTVSFPATQTYADGTVVKWDQPPLPGGGEPEHPAPMLTLGAGPTAHHHHANLPAAHAGTATSGDAVARVLGGAALAVAAIGMVLVLLRRRT
ncbi:YcnI family copper-binding membrane protein [Mycobacterium sherrisii]|uniref:Nuclear export factor GLE1 n=1 Tax=Mycobacterium sherrisii TaxID=243061 RepID=A0A1E3SSW8_9MYCO|nr:YcnI family protein [Mycobacterium sherrisii]MCV7029414.1 YcnI family protein [Mycobacterium sherrisii]MEC4761554.1 YcnI family protein [Mycobacterium sherrisii]ODR04588.1 nuclear export factor GLE1 [Mycobacterium sherrisii]ORW73236.1 nuclear export factor GLE1 [Mycobacterium sherrisii]